MTLEERERYVGRQAAELRNMDPVLRWQVM